MSKPIRGGCLCGRVQYEVTGPFDAFHLCHCSQCRHSTGSAHAANIFTSEDRLTWLAGKDLVKRYIPDKAGVISKCFCSHCGSLVPYTSLSRGRLIIPAGSYNGIDTDVHTYTLPQMWLCRKDLSEDLVYQIIKAVYENAEEKNAIHPLAKMYTIENAFRGTPGVPVGFHPGAIKYYKEKGAWDKRAQYYE